MWILCGNAIEPGDGGGSPGESFLFFLTVYCPGISLAGDRAKWQAEQSTFGLYGALSTSLENLGESMYLASGRTHNRIRSPR